MKRIIVAIAIFCLLGTNVIAFQPEIKILTREEVSKLPDENLLSTYIDAVVEVEASKVFHTTSGFMPKDYKSFKKLLRYRIILIQEIRKRGLEVPPVE